ncbi:MAG: methionine adenosyltransferase [Candidatus Anstonellales archaeon]
MNIQVEKIDYKGGDALHLEMVERKGRGHPDTLTDNIVEAISRELSKIYLEELGYIAHHNVDKAQITGGKVFIDRNGFKAHRLLKPIHIYLSGRASDEIKDNGRVRHIGVHPIAIKAVKEYLGSAMRYLDEDYYTIEPRISPGSADLQITAGKKPSANDTSFGVGYAPMSTLEELVFQVEKYLNSPEVKRKHPYAGEDVKVMGLRMGNDVKLTVACAFVARHITSMEDYFEKKEKLLEEISKKTSAVMNRRRKPYSVSITLNSGDRKGEVDSLYLTITGTSAEMGDDGSVGRGNRANGLITPFRHMTLEATAGKNPRNHVGKVYSVLAFEIAKRIAKETGSEAEVYLLSQLGRPLNQPLVAGIKLSDMGAEKKARAIAESMVEDTEAITKMIVEGKVDIV